MELQSLKRRYGIIGNSSGLNNALNIAMQVAPTDLSALILGESGVGKEVFSKIIHSLSPRKHNPFIAVNCGAIPEGTIDSELFGHEKGAFTGASDKRKGYFEEVNGGTIFLDEIGEMPLGTQSRLLRVLESGEFIKVGSSKVIKTNVRVIAATNVNLLDAVRQGKFREDLYYRLSTVPIQIPPLRERREDIYLLFRKFSVDYSDRLRMPPISLDEGAKEVLMSYPWRGNIRELKNVSERISALSSERTLNAQDLLSFLPNPNEINSRFPVYQGGGNKGHFDFSEREILYKLLFDMKREMSEMRNMLYQVLGGNMPTGTNTNKNLPSLLPEASAAFSHSYESPNLTPTPPTYPNYDTINQGSNNNPIVLKHQGEGKYTQENYNSAEVEIVEESLSIADKEKELIEKALKKHKGKRKDAALDLGIAERTLYRKIKNYHISG